MTWLTRDGRLLLAAKTLRTFGYGLLSVVLGVYLDAAGYAPSVVGGILQRCSPRCWPPAPTGSAAAACWPCARC
jgi:hypothetical protein